MTRLSLHSRDENPKLSIRLSVGQYCTVGSSAAADYRVRADGVEPVHCRIGCRSTGGYIECLDIDSKIVVNGIAKGRSRLTHGNTLRIGSVEMQVDMPGLEIPARDFEVKFEDEDTPTTKVSEALAMEHEADESSLSPTSEEAAKPGSAASEAGMDDQLEQADEFAPPTTGSFRSDSDDDNPSESDQDQPDDSSRRDSQQSESVSKGQAGNESDSPHAANPSSRSVTFEFDSSEPGDLDLSQSDIDEITQTSPHQKVMGNVDLEGAIELDSTIAEGAAGSDPQLASDNLDSKNPASEATADRDVHLLADGVNTGKHWKWTNTRAIAALRRILETDKELKIYQCDVKQIKPVEVEEFSMRWFEKQKSVVYLISRLDEMELNTLTRTKRWDDRIGHPQAVTMFLALSPQRIVSDFFESIEACVLIYEELELLRSSENLED